MRSFLAILALSAVLGAWSEGRAFAQPGGAPGSWSVSDCATCHENAVTTRFKQSSHALAAQSCATCHRNVGEHMQAQLAGEKGPVPSLKNVKAQEINATCLTCHENGARTNWHGGAHDRRDVSCTSCHSVHNYQSAKGQLKTANDFDSCFTCHKQMRAQFQRTSHHPLREGKMQCSSCHNPHDSTQPKMISAASVNDKCYQCHAEKRGPFVWEHEPVRESCVTCHNPHGSNHPRLTVAMQPYLCQRCHSNSGHPGTLYDRNNAVGGPLVAQAPPAGVTTTQTIVSQRILSRGCINCHQTIHGSNSPSGVVFGR